MFTIGCRTWSTVFVIERAVNHLLQPSRSKGLPECQVTAWTLKFQVRNRPACANRAYHASQSKGLILGGGPYEGLCGDYWCGLRTPDRGASVANRPGRPSTGPRPVVGSYHSCCSRAVPVGMAGSAPRHAGVTPVLCSVAPMLSVRNGARAVEFYKAAFGAIEVFRVADPAGSVVARLNVDGAEPCQTRTRCSPRRLPQVRARSSPLRKRTGGAWGGWSIHSAITGRSVARWRRRSWQPTCRFPESSFVVWVSQLRDNAFREDMSMRFMLVATASKSANGAPSNSEGERHATDH